MQKLLYWLTQHRAGLLFAGASLALAMNWFLYVAQGGVAPFMKSMRALNDPRVAETLSTIPEYHATVRDRLAELERSASQSVQTIRQISDTLEAYRARSETIVEWAPEHSQALTDAAGACRAGEECQVYFRGRRTQEGASCRLSTASPKLVAPDGTEIPVSFTKPFRPVGLTTRFETIPVYFHVPEHLASGTVGFLILQFYSNCPFAGGVSSLERTTFRLMVEIVAAQPVSDN